jgi:carbonic anhydrase
MIIGCVDPRVDLMDVLKLEPGEAAVIPNVGGRVTPELFQTMAILGTVSKVGNPVGQDWNLIVLHHTQCGITGCLHHAPHLLAKSMGVPEDQLAGLAIDDPYNSVEMVVPTAQLRNDCRKTRSLRF